MVMGDFQIFFKDFADFRNLKNPKIRRIFGIAFYLAYDEKTPLNILLTSAHSSPPMTQTKYQSPNCCSIKLENSDFLKNINC